VWWYEGTFTLAMGAGDSKAVKQAVQQLENGQLGEALSGLGQSDGKSASIHWRGIVRR